MPTREARWFGLLFRKLLLAVSGRKKAERRALTPEERQKYLDACMEHPFGTFAAFLYFFGLRRGEALAIRGADISRNREGIPEKLSITMQYSFPDNNQPVPGTLKTDAGRRDLPVPAKALQYIQFDDLPDGLLFTSQHVDQNGYLIDRPLSYSELVDRWHSFIRFALGDDTDVTMHYVRHNYCTMLFEQGVDIMSVQYLMGHESVQTSLQIYAHYTEQIK